MTNITIKPVKIRDVVALHRVFARAVYTSFAYFPDAYQRQLVGEHRPHKLLLARLHPRRIVLAAYAGGRIVGYAIGAVPAGGSGQLFWLYVSPDQRGRNTGLSLLSRMLQVQRTCGAHTVTLATHDHRRYYERQGFQAVDRHTLEGVEVDIMSFKVAS